MKIVRATPSPEPEIRARSRRVTRPWRWLFVIYSLALTTGTHWPNLQLVPEIPATDKTIHLVAFAGLTALLWCTRWIRNAWLVGTVAVCWAALDEITQGLPGLNRTVSHYDLMANTLGVIVVMAWLWAIKPVGVPGSGNRMRLRLSKFVFEEMFARRSAWLAVLIGVLAGGLPLLTLLPFLNVEAARLAISVAVAVCAVLTMSLWWRLWRREYSAVLATRPCLNCGANMAGMKCDRCGELSSEAQWIAPRAVPLRMMVQSGRRPMVIGVIVLAAGFGLIFALPLAYAAVLGTPSGGWNAPRIARFIGTLPPELMNVVDLTALLLLLAVIVRVYRGGIARFHDQAAICLQCGHDLRGTPTINGIGACGECGTKFVRIIELKPQMNTDEHG